jgi:hypothetical protein
METSLSSKSLCNLCATSTIFPDDALATLKEDGLQLLQLPFVMKVFGYFLKLQLFLQLIDLGIFQ